MLHHIEQGRSNVLPGSAVGDSEEAKMPVIAERRTIDYGEADHGQLCFRFRDKIPFVARQQAADLSRRSFASDSRDSKAATRPR